LDNFELKIMGCSTCGRQTVSPVVFNPKVYSLVQPPPPDIPCDYTMSQLNIWLTKLICTRDSGLYVSLRISAPNMNKYQGIVMSALNYPTNICYFKKDLDIIADIIIIIENTGKC
jgi:hypothetical protein